MGAGKSTFARAFGVDRAAEGSPTFAIAHEYQSRGGERVIHADGYRLKSDAELEETGLLESLWDPEILVLFEWMDLFPETMESLRNSELPLLEIRLDFIAGEKSASVHDLSQLRRVTIESGNG
jgi:tRNA A37 threonylcarbamoyladenosine biosynthesis protein TsaE